MNDSKIMVSEELLQQLPELSEESLNPVLKSIALVYFHDEFNDFELSGPVFSFTVTEEPEIELKVDLKTAIDVLSKKDSLNFDRVSLLHKDAVINLDGSLCVFAARIFELDFEKQTCILMLWLKNNKKIV
jgi:hypothetical protein